MQPTADDRWLDRILRDLPRQRASSDFTARVMRRLETPASGPPRRSWRWLAAAAGLVLVLAASWGVAQQRASRQARAELEALRAEHRALRAELEELRQLEAAARGVVYLGSTDDADWVLDLRRLARRLELPGEGAPGRLKGEPLPALLDPERDPIRQRSPSREGGIYR
ncbi:MAG: hypothetical protein D6696_03065 [Acidobacteria bacterium]|nr:MAG: hypothetical protein D6696_03065 [Acidobacteriota bacterium]